MSHFLKLWADKWPCTGEVKNGTVPLCHKHLIITSNFTIAEVFDACKPVTIEALERRFKTLEWTEELREQYNAGDWSLLEWYDG